MIQDLYINPKTKLCTQGDNWLQQYTEGNPVWIARLSDNTIVHQDDERYGPQYRAWQNLRQYIKESGLKIVDLSFGFRSNRFSLPPNKDGYFFSRAVRANFGGGDSLQLWFMGWIDGANVVVQKWKVPEMILDVTETRPVDEENECLIMNNICPSTVQTVI